MKICWKGNNNIIENDNLEKENTLIQEIKLTQGRFNGNVQVLDLGCGWLGFAMDLLGECGWITELAGVDDDKHKGIEEHCYPPIFRKPDNYLEHFKNNFKRLEALSCFDKGDCDKISFEPLDIISYLETTEERYEIVVLSSVLHFLLKEEDRILYYKLMASALKKGGLIFLKTL